MSSDLYEDRVIPADCETIAFLSTLNDDAALYVIAGHTAGGGTNRSSRSAPLRLRLRLRRSTSSIKVFLRINLIKFQLYTRVFFLEGERPVGFSGR